MKMDQRTINSAIRDCLSRGYRVWHTKRTQYGYIRVLEHPQFNVVEVMNAAGHFRRTIDQIELQYVAKVQQIAVDKLRKCPNCGTVHSGMFDHCYHCHDCTNEAEFRSLCPDQYLPRTNNHWSRDR